MNYKQPFIKKIKTRKNSYIYDVNTNKIFLLNKTLFSIFDDYFKLNRNSLISKYISKFSKNSIETAIHEINYLRNKGCLSYNRPEIILKNKSKKNIEDVIQSELEHLIIEVTQNCNLRCEYCCYSDRYYKIRNHKRKDISWNIISKAIDYLSRRIENSKQPNIGFYGGEPLARFDLVKKSIEYVKKIGIYNKITMRVTTNGTLLSEDVARFLIDNEIDIALSLDGPRQIHDRYRVFTSGKGTFSTIMKNLDFIRKCNSDYYKRKIGFTIIQAPPYCYDKIDNFFMNKFNDILNLEDKLNLSYVDTNDTTFFQDFNLEEEDLSSIDRLNNYVKFMYNKEYDKIGLTKKSYDMQFYDIHMREMSDLGKSCPPHGTCIPGQRRLFMDVIGDFYMCEKVNSNYKIGNVNRGIEADRIENFFIEFENFFKKCKDCWALRFCKKCYNIVRDGEEFREERRDKFCMNKVKEIENQLIYYCGMREKRENIFEPLEELHIM